MIGRLELELSIPRAHVAPRGIGRSQLYAVDKASA